jgi:8-oxo-dGTP pyrophosphatase MutT (NUDIX family)
LIDAPLRSGALPRVTCGVLVLDCRRNLLIGQATGSKRWDIPKGIADPGEPWAQAAVRELREETGLMAEPDRLSPLGVHPYLPGKRLALFAWEPACMPDPAALRCTSTFLARDGRVLPELARFAVLPWAEALARLGKNMARVLGDPALLRGPAASPDCSAAG